MRNIKKNVILALSLASVASLSAGVLTANTVSVTASAATIGGVENVVLTYAGASVRTASTENGG